MKKTPFLLLCLLALTTLHGQTPLFQWAKSFVGSDNNSEGTSVTVDAAGNVLTTGLMRETTDFDPGPGTYILNSISAIDIFISKLDAAGNFLWAKQIGAIATDEGRSIVTDAAGNVYVTGVFQTEQDFDPGPGVFLLSPSTTNFEVFVLKLDPNGNFIWARNIGSTGGDYGYAIGIDNSGNLIISGAFIATVDFDPGAGNFSLTAPGGFTDVFVCKWNTNGDFIWAKQLGGSESEFCYGINIDAAGNILSVGYFTGTADFDPGPATFNLVGGSTTDMFISKLNNDGNFVWAKRIGGPTHDALYGGIGTDAVGNVFFAAPFQGVLDVDPGAAVVNLTSAGQFDVLFCKLTAAGDFVWGKRWGSTAHDIAYAVELDAGGNVYVAGSFTGNVDFDPAPGVAQFFLNTFSSQNSFISKLDNNGNFVWAMMMGGTGGSDIYSMHVNAANEIFTTGFFGATGDFDPGTGVANLTAGGGSDVFITKIGQGGVLPLTLVRFSAEATAAGNVLKWETAQEINTDNFIIEWSRDGQQFEMIATQTATGNSNSISRYQYTHTQRADGNNYYRLRMNDRDGRFTYSPVVRINTAASQTQLLAFPNPVKDQLTLNIQSVREGQLRLSLYSMDGKMILSRSVALVKGNNIFSWDLQSLPAGRYFIASDNKDFKPVQLVK